MLAPASALIHARAAAACGQAAGPLRQLRRVCHTARQISRRAAPASAVWMAAQQWLGRGCAAEAGGAARMGGWWQQAGFATLVTLKADWQPQLRHSSWTAAAAAVEAADETAAGLKWAPSLPVAEESARTAAADVSAVTVASAAETAPVAVEAAVAARPWPALGQSTAAAPALPAAIESAQLSLPSPLSVQPAHRSAARPTSPC